MKRISLISKKITSFFIIVSILMSSVLVFASANQSTTVIANGVCGANLTWSLTDNGVLTIEGTGDMYDYNNYFDDRIPNYEYDSEGGFYFLDDERNWNESLSYDEIFETISPAESVLFDSIRICFDYEGKEWLLEFKKGQYESCFVGAETGIYTASAGSSVFYCADKDDWLNMQLDCYWSESDNGHYRKIFTREYNDYWLSTGLVNGQLTNSTNPIEELKSKNIITFKSEEMANAFVNELKKCGFIRSAGSNQLVDDSYYQNGADVWFLWTSINYDCFDDNKGTVPSESTVTVNSTQQKWNEYTDAIKKVVIGEGVTSIGDFAFRDCSALESIEMNDNISKIGVGAFGGCTSLKEIDISNGTTEIGELAFVFCRALETIKIPSGLVSVGESAFLDCYNIENIYYAGDLAGWCNIDFADADSSPLKRISTYLSIGGNLLEEELVIPDGVTRIPNGAFRYLCRRFRAITIPESVKSIGISAFGQDPSWDGRSGFYFLNYTGSEEEWNAINIESDNDELDRTTNFNYNGTLSGECGENLLWSLDLLSEELTISGTGDMYDYGDFGPGWFAYGDYIKIIIIEEGVTSIGDAAFDIYTYYPNKIEKVEISNTVTKIGNGAFWGCNFKNIVIPEGVTEIGKAAFAYCERMEIVTIPKTVNYIGNGAFDSCYNLTDIYYDAKKEQWDKIDNQLQDDDLDGVTIHFKQELDTKTEEVLLECYDDVFESGVDVSVNVSKKTIDPHFYFSTIVSSGENAKYKPCVNYDITLKNGDEEVQPSGKVTVKLKIPSDKVISEQDIINENVVILHYPKDPQYSGDRIPIMGAERLRLENGYIVFEVEHFSYFMICLKSDESTVQTDAPSVHIRNNPGTATINYGDTITLHADVTDLPEGAEIWWYINGEKAANTESVIVDYKSDYKIAVKIIDADGNVLVDENGNEIGDSLKVTVNDSVWIRIAYYFAFVVNFFKMIFYI